jgi:RimJ/RimL family protein N-acetyltransferase
MTDRKQVSVRAESFDEPTLRSIQAKDQELLRNWKNEHHESSFHQQVITAAQQSAWFPGYCQRENDFMFMVRHGEQEIGCMGIRQIEDSWDIYNVILAKKELGKQGLMSRALRMTCSFALNRKGAKIGLQVLKTNPAVEWYSRNHFRTAGEGDSFFEMTLDTSSFQPSSLQLSKR